MSPREKVTLIEASQQPISVSRQAELLGVARSTIYYQPVVSRLNLELMRRIDEQYTKTPFYGSRRMTAMLNRHGYEVNRKRVQRLMRLMGLEAIYPKPRLSQGHPEHKVYPYLLRGLPIIRVNQVWGTDITYIPLKHGWLYLVALMDWFSRYVVSWELSASLEVDFCLRALDRALSQARPEIVNSDQGSQFTSVDFTCRLEQNQVKISMDGRGRAMDNIFTERLWRSLKYEDVYIKDYETVRQATEGIRDYLNLYNYERPHQSLKYQTPAEIYFGVSHESQRLAVESQSLGRRVKLA